MHLCPGPGRAPTPRGRAKTLPVPAPRQRGPMLLPRSSSGTEVSFPLCPERCRCWLALDSLPKNCIGPKKAALPKIMTPPRGHLASHHWLVWRVQRPNPLASVGPARKGHPSSSGLAKASTVTITQPLLPSSAPLGPTGWFPGPLANEPSAHNLISESASQET